LFICPSPCPSRKGREFSLHVDVCLFVRDFTSCPIYRPSLYTGKDRRIESGWGLLIIRTLFRVSNLEFTPNVHAGGGYPASGRGCGLTDYGYARGNVPLGTRAGAHGCGAGRHGGGNGCG
jgi:hypothetical protein